MDAHIGGMSRPSNREKILTEGLRVVHERGFAGASVRDIVHAAGVPQGSFTNHFASKEAFGLEVLDLYFSRASEQIRDTLANEALRPLQRLRAYFEARKRRLLEDGLRKGCLFGNFTADMGEHSEPVRLRILEIFAHVRQAIADCLRAAVAAGEVPSGLDCDAVAAFVVASMQGAILISKAERSLAPVERLETMLFTRILR
jgi:TetR/AcrR family transcriptional repressor of nem operon